MNHRVDRQANREKEMESDTEERERQTAKETAEQTNKNRGESYRQVKTKISKFLVETIRVRGTKSDAEKAAQLTRKKRSSEWELAVMMCT